MASGFYRKRCIKITVLPAKNELESKCGNAASWHKYCAVLNCFGSIAVVFKSSDMRRIIKIGALVAVIAAVLCSCTKEGTGRFKGNYSFKTSGSISVREKNNTSAEVIRLNLSDESGQMDILETDGTNGGMMVTMNVLSGPVLVFDAEADGKVLNLLPKTRILTVRHGVEHMSVEVLVEGTGNRYDNSLIFNLNYSGTYVRGDIEYEIIESDVQCVAKKN